MTMADVAARAGVSKKTVSAVVNGVGQVSRRTDARVRAAIEELGFLPNPAARSLNSRRAGVITLALPHLGSGDLAAIASAVIAAAETAGVGVVVEPTGGDPAREGEVLRPGAGITDGVLLIPSRRTLPVVPGVPVVVIGDRMVQRTVAQVVAPAEASITVAAEVTGESGELVVVAAEEDADLVPESLGATVVPAEDASAGAAFRAVVAERTLFSSGTPNRPRADRVVTLGGGSAIGVAHALRTLGLDIPADVRLAAVGGGGEPAFADPPITTVAPDVRQLAEIAVGRLLGHLDGSDRTVRYDEVGLLVTRRASTGS
ncbi:LacI family transcriptional regulator [Microlunatus endophyticus]|uniref:LacI family transcriptional regulator n=2 Tax=Microlunatus endophyticus TaxID=1716077 RepID=A0A917SFG5_9ACTN|nr:LacI family transcriptional regulator [Microlunatus endophyticus]